jgi:hypothetical protein
VGRAKGASPAQRGDAGEARKPDAFGKRPSSSRIPHPNQYAVSDGRTPLGTVEAVNGAFVAIDTAGIAVGTFASLREASRAFDEGGA